MEQLTKKQKLRAVKEAYKIFKKDDAKVSGFLCIALAYGVDEVLGEGSNVTSIEAIRLIPEVLKYKPEDKHIGSAWWEVCERELRIKVFKSLIKDLS